MDIQKKVVKGVLWSVIESWGSQAISLIVFFLLARLLSPEAFGLVSMANVFLAFMNVFLDQGFAQALIQCKKLEPEHLDTAFWTNLVIGIVLTSSAFVSADFVANGFNQPLLTPIIRCFSPLFLITSLGHVQRAILERSFDFKAIANRSLLGLLISGGVGVTMAFSGFGVWSLVCQQLTNELVGTFVLWQASSWRPGLKFSRNHFNQLFHFGISLLCLNFIGFFNKRGNDFLIGYFLGPSTLGFYVLAYRVLDVMMQLLVRTTGQVALPAFSRLQEDLEKFRNTFYTSTQLTSLIAFPVFFGLASLAPEVIVILFGGQWQPSIPIVQILAFAGIVQSVSFFKGHILMAMGKPSWRLWQALLSIVLNLIGFAVAFQWGVIAISIAYVTRRYIVFPIGQWAIQLLIHFSWRTYLRQFITPIVCSIVMVFFIFTLKGLLTNITESKLLILSTCTLFGLMTYGTTIRLCAPEVFQKITDIARIAVSTGGCR
ncbi:MAG: MOP flippase family protein [Leptolyngbyaceae cyanobacterium MO_188.B28]|nr:MOP flippase family protein [Leptolyngbyaceae cyanobacterium MO_188.B28]